MLPNEYTSKFAHLLTLDFMRSHAHLEQCTCREYLGLFLCNNDELAIQNYKNFIGMHG